MKKTIIILSIIFSIIYTTKAQKIKKTYYDNGNIESIGSSGKKGKEGEWKHYYENGKIQVIVNWKNDELHGKYEQHYKYGGRIKLGIYKNGKKDGFWEISATSYIAKGNYKNDLKIGEWKHYDDDKVIAKGYYKNSLKTGEWKHYNKDGKLIESVKYSTGGEAVLHKFYNSKGQVYKTKESVSEDKGDYIETMFYKDNPSKVESKGAYKHGAWTSLNMVGEWKFYYLNGQLKEIGYYSSGDKNGIWKVYYENGQLSEIGSYDSYNEYKSGKWKYYNANGKLRLLETYKDGKVVDSAYIDKVSVKFYFTNETIMLAGNYIGDNKSGLWNYYFSNGNSRETGSYNNDGARTGEWKIYYKNGKLHQTVIYKNGGLMNIKSCYDMNGNPKKKGTLKNGNGTIEMYNYFDELVSMEYADGHYLLAGIEMSLWDSSEDLNKMAWKSYENDYNKAKLLNSIKWIERSIDLNINSYNTDTYAHLLLKIGDYSRAYEIAKYSIELSKKRNIDYSSTSKLLEKIIKIIDLIESE